MHRAARWTSIQNRERFSSLSERRPELELWAGYSPKTPYSLIHLSIMLYRPSLVPGSSSAREANITNRSGLSLSGAYSSLAL
jgi:hypothetical protein